MPARKKLAIEEYWADELQDDLKKRGLRHLRVRRRADLLVLESGPSNAPWPHARFRRETVHLWRLEFPNHSGTWETTPFRDQLARLVDALINDFPWTLANDS